MSQAVSGQVKEYTSFDYRGTLLYSFQLEGDRTYYRTGDRNEQLNAGDNINFTFTEKGDKSNVDKGSIQRSAGTASVPSQPNQRSSGGASGATGSSRDSYWGDKETYDKGVTQPRISWSAAQHDAVALVAAAFQHDAIGFGNAAKSKRMGIILEVVREVTEELALRNINGHLNLAILRKRKEAEVAQEMQKQAPMTIAEPNTAYVDWDDA